jgi:protein-tyrosine sulfotransferase
VTAASQRGPCARESSGWCRAAAGDLPGPAPVIVLAAPYFGAGWLRASLESHPDLACTSGTGILQLCEQAMAAWRGADGPSARTRSAPAITATRALASSIITSLLAREGKWRWCEFSIANTQAAGTFLRLYPDTRILCLHRDCVGVIRATMNASPSGRADEAFAPFAMAYPASTVAARTAYWVARTGPLLAFEQSHPQACLRVRFEDLTLARRKTAERISSFLGIVGLEGPGSRAVDNHTRPEPGSTGPEAEFPVDLIPPALLAQANGLLSLLGYPALSAGSAR